MRLLRSISLGARIVSQVVCDEQRAVVLKTNDPLGQAHIPAGIWLILRWIPFLPLNAGDVRWLLAHLTQQLRAVTSTQTRVHLRVSYGL